MVLRGHVRQGVAVLDEPAELPEGAEVRVEVLAAPLSPVARRAGGQWKGRVTIAPDFDDLPDDLAEAFGVHSP